MPAFLALTAMAAFSWPANNAHAGPPDRLATSPANATEAMLPTVTIAARRELKRRVDRFVTAEIFQPPGEPLMRWNTPICPLVQGLPAEFNDFIQAHILQIALAAHAPVGGKGCEPDLYVFATPQPDLLLKKLLASNPGMYDSSNGLGGVRRFLHSRRPVRAWYNAALHCRSRRGVSASMALRSVGNTGGMSGPGGAVNGSSSSFCVGGDTRTGYSNVNSVSSVVIVVDMSQMQTITTRELADYVAMIGLADIRLDARAGAVPTILGLFQHPGPAPEGLSPWDRALLFSLYNTRQSSVVQVSDMEATVMRRIGGQGEPGLASSGPSGTAIPLWANELLPQRDATAIYWYRIAADQNNPAAQYDLAVRYVLGQGVPQSYAKAAEWYRRAGEQGYRDAQYNLAIMYANGQGVPRDDAEAARWYRKAAEQGYVEAQFNLAYMYANGEGVPQDFAKAAEWYGKAAEQGSSGAQNDLAVMYENGQGVPQDYAKAAQWFRKAAEQGDAGAQGSLGIEYAKGQGVPRNYALAAQWFRKAAEQGDARAQFDLGVLYSAGEGVPRDSVDAYKWWVLAKSNSSPGDVAYESSRNRMTVSASRMTADQLARAHREASEWLAAHRSAR